MKKICFVLIVLMMVLLCGCDNNSELSSPVNNSGQDLEPAVTGEHVDSTGEDDSAVYSVAEGYGRILRTYSPDGSNYIREEYDPDSTDDLGGIFWVNLYLNDETQPIKQVLIEDLNKYIDKPRVVWLDNDHVLLRGRYILNIKNTVIQKIDFDKLGIYVYPAAEDYAAAPDEADAHDYGYGTLNYSVNKDGNKISYLFSDIKEENYYAYLYDMQKQTWEKIYSRPATFYDEEAAYYCIGWGNDNNLYFSDWENVYKYDGQTVELFYAKDTTIFYMAVSPQGRYMVICNAGGKADQENFRKGQFSYIDLADGAVKFTFASLGNNAFSPQFTWSYDDKAFAYVDTDGVIKVLSLPDMKELLSQKVENPKDIDMIDYWNGTFVYF